MAQIEASRQSTKVTSYCCHNCNASNYLSIKRRRINNRQSFQLWSCSNCGFKWKEIWSSHSKSVWSLQYHSMQLPKAMMCIRFVDYNNRLYHMSRKEAFLSVLTIVITLAASIVIALTEFGSVGTAQGQGNLTIGN
jgi:hypothetical protein